MYCDWPTLKRCCFCMPLRRGVLVFAYLNIIFSGFMIGVYSFAVNSNRPTEIVYHGTMANLPAELCLVIYCLEIVFNALLLYGAHKKIKKYVQVYYYFSIATTLTSLLMGILDVATTRPFYLEVELIMFGFVGLAIQLYLLLLVSGLLKKLEEDSAHSYENQLHQFINGQIKVDANGVYNASTVPNEIFVHA